MRTIIATLLVATCTFAIAGEKETSGLRVATFRCSVTPPLGSPLRHHPLESVENSLLAKNDEVANRLAASVKKAIGELEPFDHIGIGEAKVDRVAFREDVVSGKPQR